MLTNLLKWLKPQITQETEESVLIKNALKNDQIDIEENDTILFDKGLAGYGIFGQRQEALVLDYTHKDVQVTYIIKTTKKTRWIPIYSITSNLGDEYKTIEELTAMGLLDPKPQRAPNKPLLSGTYINVLNEDDEEKYQLVEIEKVNGQYYIHGASSTACQPINQDHEYDLLEFSPPEEGKYILDPGLYIRTDKLLYEVIPFKGSSWYRRIDESNLHKLTANEALKLTRVETDETTPGFYIIDQIDQIDQEETKETPKNQENCGCYGCVGEINTQNQPEPTPQQENNIIDIIHYDEYLKPYQAPKTEPPTGLLDENGQVNLDVPYPNDELGPYTPGFEETHPTDPI